MAVFQSVWDYITSLQGGGGVELFVSDPPAYIALPAAWLNNIGGDAQ